MSVLADQLDRVLLPEMSMPSEFPALFDWIEANNLYVDNDAGRVGFLFPEDELKDGWAETERPGGTNIEFAAGGNANVHYWFGHDRVDVIDRLCVFAQTGAEGSEAAFWIDETGRQRIVHMGSGSGSVLCCVLAETPIDFLRLLAIGYDEICWNAEFAFLPNSPEVDSGLFVQPNVRFQQWVRDTFGIDIPKRASDIVKHPSEIGDTNSLDDFCKWVNQNVG